MKNLDLFFLVIMICNFIFYGCSSVGSFTPEGVVISNVQESLKKAEIRLTCGTSCAGAWGLDRAEMKKLHDNELWNDLAILVAKIGFGSDQTYYYLGRSAEGIGYHDAARTYYGLAKTSFKCDGIINNCDGLVFPKQVDERLKLLPELPQATKNNSTGEQPLPLLTTKLDTQDPIYSTQSLNSSNVSDNKCNYESLIGNEYKIDNAFRPYVTNDFFINPDAEKIEQLVPIYAQDDYKSLITDYFKVVTVGVVTAEDRKRRSEHLSTYRYVKEDYNGSVYIRDTTFSTKVRTSDCKDYYLAGNTNKEVLAYRVKHIDGAELTDTELFDIFGSQVFSPTTIVSTVEYDKFSHSYKVSTPLFDHVLIRSQVDANGNIEFIQIYSILRSADQLGAVKTILDTEGNRHEVTRISNDTTCYTIASLHCGHTSTIGITINLKFLK